MKRTGIVILSILLIIFFSQPVLARDAPPSDSFAHWNLPGGVKKVVAMRPLYDVVATVTARSLGIGEDIGTFVDIDCDKSGNTYILTAAGRIICFDSDYRLVRDYEIIGEDGETVDFSGAMGIYVYSDTEIYIADTKNSRVLYILDGVVKQEITLPDSALIPSDFVFQPTKVARDGKGYLYVISEGSYYGAVLYDPAGEFSGFYGANTVRGNVLNTISYIWDRLTMNDVKRSKTRKVLPFQFTDIFIDDSGFVYTCTGMSSSGNTEQIRMLSPGGTNILPGVKGYNFGEMDHVKRLNIVARQNFNSICADGRGFIYALDGTFGLVYIYDTERNMITAFGGGRGLGGQAGVFADACSIALSGDRLMVADSLKNSVTVFKKTDFGKVLMDAQRLTMDADYINAKPLWESVHKYDFMNHLALRGLAKAAYMEGDYKAAMNYAKEGDDVVTYSQALEKVMVEFISANFVWLFLLAFILLAGLTALIILTRKRQVVLISNAKLRTLFRGTIHPFQSFNDVKYKNMGSLRLAVVLTLLFFLSSAASVIWSDFRFTAFDASTYHTFFHILQTVGLIALWSVANWGVSTLQEGKGRLKEVFIVSAYSTLPLIIYNIISAPLSYILVSPNSTLINGLHTLAYIFTGIMLCIGLMIIHDFSFPRFLFTAFVTVLFMVLIIFVLFMAGTLLTQFWSFISDVTLEAIRWQ